MSGSTRVVIKCNISLIHVTTSHSSLSHYSLSRTSPILLLKINLTNFLTYLIPGPCGSRMEKYFPAPHTKPRSILTFLYKYNIYTKKAFRINTIEQVPQWQQSSTQGEPILFERKNCVVPLCL